MASSASSSKGAVPPHDMKTKSQLTILYNKPVVFAERLTRPMGLPSSAGVLSHVGVLNHSGVRVTLEDGRPYLIHKGKDFGIQSGTVVVDAKHMSKSWEVTQSKPVQGKTVGDFVKAGGTDYNLFFDNCHMGAERMMK